MRWCFSSALALLFGLILAIGAAGNLSAEIASRFLVRGVEYEHDGGGLFRPVGTSDRAVKAPTINLRQVMHRHDPVTNPDVPIYTDITLPGETPQLRDEQGRPFALITLYNIDPPLEDLPSREPGIDREWIIGIRRIS